MTRVELEQLYPIRKQVEKADTIEGLWLAGLAILLLDDKLLKGTVEKVILPWPKTEQLQRLVPLTGYADDGEMEADIYKATRRVRDLGGQVRWLVGFPQFTLLLADADKPHGWIHVELLTPNARSEAQPVFRLSPKRDLEAFARFKTVFTDMWSQAESPPKELLP